MRCRSHVNCFNEAKPDVQAFLTVSDETSHCSHQLQVKIDQQEDGAHQNSRERYSRDQRRLYSYGIFLVASCATVEIGQQLELSIIAIERIHRTKGPGM